MHKRDITAAVVARLVAEQFPEWADLPVAPVELDGWDNTTFRLGRELSVRLPSHDVYVVEIEKEHRWLPVLAPQLPLPVPTPVALGAPSETFPRPWSVYGWIDGDTVTTGGVADRVSLAEDLAGFLRALQAVDPTDGPPPGQHSFDRGGPLEAFDALARRSLHALGDDPVLTALWEESLASTFDGPPVWAHGDVTGSNLLVGDGRLSAVLDFGCSAVGDPACDLVMAWTFFEGESAEVFRRLVDTEDGTWARARGWALWRALVTTVDGRDVVRRYGWAFPADEVLRRLRGE